MDLRSSREEPGEETGKEAGDELEGCGHLRDFSSLDLLEGSGCVEAVDMLHLRLKD